MGGLRSDSRAAGLGGKKKSFKFFDLFVLRLKTGVIVEGFADRSEDKQKRLTFLQGSLKIYSR